MNEFIANGPSYPIASYGIAKLYQLNAVEWAKKAAIALTGAESTEEKRRAANCAIDAFIAVKFAIIAAAWYFNLAGTIPVGIAAYLLVFNLFTYFWYHLWLPRVPAYATDNPYRERRRFMNLLSAMAFSIVTYAFLYHRVMSNHFDWPRDVAPATAALTFSIGNALTGAVGDLHAKTATAYLVMSSQLLMTFIFVAILLNASIPTQKRGQEE